MTTRSSAAPGQPAREVRPGSERLQSRRAGAARWLRSCAGCSALLAAILLHPPGAGAQTLARASGGAAMDFTLAKPHGTAAGDLTDRGARALSLFAGDAPGLPAAGMLPRLDRSPAVRPRALARSVGSAVILRGQARSGGPVAERVSRRALAPTPVGRLGSRLRRALPASTGTRLHVSPQGSDSASGSASTPLRTIQRAVDLARPGAMVLVHAGAYDESVRIARSGTAGRPITIRAAPGGRVTVRAARASRNSYALEFAGASHIRVQGLVLQGSTGPSSANVYVHGGRSLELSDCEIRGAQRQGIFIDAQSRGVQVLRCLIHDNGSRASSGQDHGLYVQGRDHLIASCLIMGHRHGYGIQVYPAASGVTVVGNTIVRNGAGGILVGGEESTTSSGTTIANNIVAWNAYGIRTYWSDRAGTGNRAFSNLGHANRDGDFADDRRGIRYFRNVVADPRFADAAAGDFRLSAGSPARDSAAIEFAPIRDLNGSRRRPGAEPDIGAIEG